MLHKVLSFKSWNLIKSKTEWELFSLDLGKMQETKSHVLQYFQNIFIWFDCYHASSKLDHVL